MLGRVIILNMHYLLLYQYTANWLPLFKGILILLFSSVDLLLIYDWPVDKQIWAFLTRSEYRVSDPQVAVKAESFLFQEIIKSKHKFMINNMLFLYCVLGLRYLYHKHSGP